MLEATAVYFLFRLGQGFLDVLRDFVDILNTRLFFLDFPIYIPGVHEIVRLIFTYTRLGDYTVFEMIVGPGLVILFYVSFVRFFKLK